MDDSEDEDTPILAIGHAGQGKSAAGAGNEVAGKAARSLPDEFKPGSALRKSVLFQTAKFVERETGNLPAGVSSVSSDTVAALADLTVRFSESMARGGFRC